MPPIKQTFASATRNRLAANKGPPPSFLMPRINSRKDARERAAETGADFPVGGTKVYLYVIPLPPNNKPFQFRRLTLYSMYSLIYHCRPTFHITMQHNPRLTPSQAQFQVPLYFSKLDLKDLLWHAYRVRISTVRSWVIESKIINVPRNSKRDIPGKKTQIRPQATKKMIVGLEKPFVWPPSPDFKEQGLLGKADQKLSEVQKKSGKVMSSAEEREKYQRGMRAEKYEALEQKVLNMRLGRDTWKGNELEEAEAVSEAEKQQEKVAKMPHETAGFDDSAQKSPTADERTQISRLEKVEDILTKSATQAEAEQALESELGTPKQAPTMPAQDVKQSVHEARVMARAAMLADHGIRPRRTSPPKERKVVEL